MEIFFKRQPLPVCPDFWNPFNSGVPILETLSIVETTSGNQVVAKAVSDIQFSVRQGDTVSEPMSQHPVFTPLAVDMIAVGEESGSMDELMQNLAETYELEVDEAVAALSSLIEPLLIVFLGVVIGFIVIALYLPIILPPV